MPRDAARGAHKVDAAERLPLAATRWNARKPKGSELAGRAAAERPMPAPERSGAAGAGTPARPAPEPERSEAAGAAGRSRDGAGVNGRAAGDQPLPQIGSHVI
ncbi:hypothetical protein [Paenibacillus validus]|uniref:hypothetical protein n=1 Tax=Paenibacillus validus TaxID=44253 RepID=UPI000FDCB3A8|nr:hypothetical protein [Paenibacillus validus]